VDIVSRAGAGTMKFLIFLCLLQRVASLSLTLQPTTFAGQQSLLIWERQPVDGTGELTFNLRFVQGTDQEDAGMAASEVTASSSQQSGTVQVVFPNEGSYEVIAVDGSGNTLGTSNNVLAIAGPSASATASASILPSASSKPSGTSSTPQRSKAPVIVGSVIGSLVLLAFLAIVLILLIRRRRRNNETKRWTFHRDMMVQACQQPTAPSSSPSPIAPPSPSSVYSTSTYPEDLERGLHALPPVVPSTQLPTPDPNPRLPDPVLYPTRVAGLLERRPTIRRLDLDPSNLPRSPMGPRPPMSHPAALSSAILRSARPMSPIPRSPSPRTHRQRAISDQIEILRIQMLEVERDGVKDHIGMSEMSDKMAWLREQQEGSWALGLTEVTPLGYDRYMT